MSGTPGQDFTVHVGVDLPTEAVTRITRAIQRAVLLELADTAVADGYSVGLKAPKSRDDEPGEEVPLGIWIEASSPRLPQ